MLQQWVPPKGYNPSETVQYGPFPAAVPAKKSAPGVGSSSRATVSARSLLQHGLSTGCTSSCSVWGTPGAAGGSLLLHGPHGLQGHSLVFSRGCQRNLSSGALTPPPASPLTLGSAELISTYFSLSSLITTALWFLAFLTALSQRCHQLH